MDKLQQLRSWADYETIKLVVDLPWIRKQPRKQKKAYKINWLKCVDRLNEIRKLLSKLDTLLPPHNFKPGGIVSAQPNLSVYVDNSERII